MSGKKRIIVDIEMIKTMYEDEKKSLPDISKMIGVTISTIRLRLIECGVTLRSTAEAIRLHPEKLGSGNRGKKRVITEEWKENQRIAAIRRWEGKAKGISLKPSGYYEITRGENKGRLLHDVIMEIHIGRRLEKNEVVHHKNGIRTDNEITNLLLMTRGGHCSHHAKISVVNGTCYDISKESKGGELHNNAKLTEDQVLTILKDNRTNAEIAYTYGVTKSCIKHIKKRRTWKHLNK
jgi:hypothetical protein